jgi:hypothetical protein
MPPKTMRVRPRRSTMPSPNRRIAVIARVNSAKPAPAWSRGTCRTSARNTALQSSIEPSARNTTKASTPMNSTTPCGSASRAFVQDPLRTPVRRRQHRDQQQCRHRNQRGQPQRRAEDQQAGHAAGADEAADAVEGVEAGHHRAPGIALDRHRLHVHRTVQRTDAGAEHEQGRAQRQRRGRQHQQGQGAAASSRR